MSSVGPSLPASRTPLSSSTSAVPNSSSSGTKNARSNLSEGTQTAQVQREATEKAAEMRDRVTDVQREGQWEVDRLKQNYANEYLAETSREESQLDTEKLKGYGRLRDLQQQQAKEYARVQRQGESQLSELDFNLKKSALTVEQSGEEQLRDMQTRYARQIEFERSSGQALADQLHKEQAMTVDQVRNDANSRVDHEKKLAAEFYEKNRESTAEAMNKAAHDLDERYLGTLHTHQQTMDRINTQATTELEQARLGTSHKLAAYSERQADPFYKMLDMKAEFVDAGDRYVLTAQIPEHEQEHVNVAVRGNQLVLSGYRRNEEKTEIEPGRTRGTNSYQSYLESFPFSHPVEAKAMTREFRGSTLTITLPKQMIVQGYTQYKSKVKPLPITVQKPNFPENLPHVGEDATLAKGTGKGNKPLG